jgi:hypothetical protein
MPPALSRLPSSTSMTTPVAWRTSSESGNVTAPAMSSDVL